MKSLVYSNQSGSILRPAIATTARQLPRLNRIHVLKDLGLTLDQIVRLVDKNVSGEEIHGMLTMKKAQIEQTLHDPTLGSDAFWDGTGRSSISSTRRL